MKRIFSITLSVFFILSLAIMPKSSYLKAAGKAENLGVPHHSIGILSAVYGLGPNGEEAIYAPSNGNPAVLNVINAKTGEKISTHLLEGATQAWGTVIDKFGQVYIAGGANLYRYDPDKDKVENLGRAVKSETTLWHIKADDEGRIYGGSYPNGKVFMYDPAKNQFIDFGSIVEGEQYSRSIALYKNDIFVGMGSRAHLIKFNPKTGGKTEIILPEKYQKESFVYDLDVVKDRLFARMSDSSTLLVYDLKQSKWINEITGVKGVKVSPKGPKNLVYFNKDNELFSYNLKTNKLSATGFHDTWSNKGFGWVHLNEPDFTGPSLSSVIFNGQYWVYNPKSGKSKFIQAEMEGQPIGLQSIGLGPDGNIYTSGYLTGGFARYSPSENKITSFSGFGQAENMISTSRYLYLGVYPGAEIYQYDPNKPYDYNPSNIEESTNPKRIFSLKKFDQDRPFGLAEGDGKVFIGTVPSYGKLGGTLTIFDEKSGSNETYQDLIPNQSIISLQYKDGLIIGGTSIWGGLGAEPVAEEGKIFIFDVATKQKIYEGTPLPGEKAIGALSIDKDGYLWGMSPGKIFKFDLNSRQVIQSKQLFPFSWTGLDHYWRGAFINYDKDGHFYGSTLGNLFTFNPDTWEIEVLENNAALFSKDKDGNLYFGRDAELFRFNR
ncbi:WD40 repeat domain-containing protein [Heyndrickxia sporothermodurans]